MTDFEKRVNEYMQCDKKTLAELLALRDLNNITPIEEPKTPLRDVQFPPYQPIPNTPYVGDPPPNYPWNPNGPFGPLVWYTPQTTTRPEN